VTFHATVAHPYADREHAVSGLRDRLVAVTARASAGTPDWSTLVVGDPQEVVDDHSRTWYVWLATVETSLEAPAA
jgi:hypothetical protein